MRICYYQFLKWIHHYLDVKHTKRKTLPVHLFLIWQVSKLYTYTGNDPLDKTDPSGQFTCTTNPGGATETCVSNGSFLDNAALGVYHAYMQLRYGGMQSADDKPKDSGDQRSGTSDEKPKTAPTSPAITPDDLKGKTREQIDQGAKDKGLVPDPKKPNKYRDPVTGKERVRVDPWHIDRDTGKPYNNPNAAGPHVHGYDETGGKIVYPETGDPHFPLQDDPSP